MLQNETQTEPSVLPGQVRITPEELNQAVAAIESRRQAEAQRLAGTIPIEEAVSSLHLDATHEEVWAEVQAQRMAAARKPVSAVQQQPFSQYVALPAAIQTPFVTRSSRRPWRRLITAGVIFSVLWGTGVFHHSGHSVRSAPAVMSSLTQIPDGKQFYCDTATLVQLSEGKQLPNIRVAATADDNTWTAIKMNGHVYLHAYTLPISSLTAQKGKPITLYNDDNSGALHGERTSQTTLRIDGVPLQVSGGGDDYTEITVPDFQPDQFTTTSDWR